MTDLFSEKAKDWDVNEMVLALSNGIGGSLKEKVKLNEQMQVLDFGAGTGLLTSHVAPDVAKVTAVDVSESMLEQLLAKEALKDQVETVCQDIVHHPLGRTFDLIISAMAMHHVEDTEQMLKSFAAHLKPGAKVALADLDKEDGTFHPEGIEGVFHDGFEREAFQMKLERSGFKDVRFTTAHTVDKGEKQYPVFLVVATKQ